MADQKLVAIHHVTTLAEQFLYYISKTCNFKKRLVLNESFRTFRLFFLASVVLRHYLSKFAKRCIKNEYFKNFQM